MTQSIKNLWQISKQDFVSIHQNPKDIHWYRDQFRSPLQHSAPDCSRYSRALSLQFNFSLPSIYQQYNSNDGTIKLLLQLQDGALIETVLIPFHRKYSVCLSSQVGCRVKCTFCRTGTMNNFRQLDQSEIIGQYLVARQVLRQKYPASPSPNIVFMGQGEPLQNFNQVKNSIALFLDPWAIELGPRQITLSTSGHLPGLFRWHEMGGVNLAISLHNAIQSEREKLIPLAKQYPLHELKQTLRQLKLRKRQFITLEYLLLKDVNHGKQHLDAFIDFCQDLPVIVNLIEFNPYPGAHYARPNIEQVEEFKEGLVKAKIPTMLRSTKGLDIAAACGQLASEKAVELLH